jgi:phosphoglycerate dehydrogenase-like enzyme
MALILALARRIPQMSEVFAEGAWGRGRRLMNTAHRLCSQVLGLVGFGDSAHAVARRARGFGMRILATRKHLDAPSPIAEELGVEMVDLETLLRESDYVSLHLPLNERTYHFFDEDLLRKMKPEAYLINTARGAVTDERALAAALRAGHLAGAGIDTYEEDYPFKGVEEPPDYPPFGLENVILTPHVAALSVEARQDVARMAVENTVAVLRGHFPDPKNMVNPGVIDTLSLADYDSFLFQS